ncbi:FadR family transcriptional regulator [Marivibrio halodurans]|uniref:FadR family transcriptional regulator n=1 Tax=Marivibrio halodurans TaxID=2039722 RepID=A0A8J7RYF4_9PROT|nr:FCD domain-containing protein [Marivibrio halodurans]MBP5855418.1 FadR family transcriptional regulator [Marivibrio halodurans]
MSADGAAVDPSHAPARDSATQAGQGAGGEDGDSLHFRKLAVAPTYRVVAETIEREIMEGRLQPGDRLPSETALAEQLGVNRSTAREGLRLLEQTGLVERKSGRRLHAAIPGHVELSTRASRALLLQQVTFIDLHQLLMALEPAAAAMAATTIGEDDLAALERNLAETEARVERGETITALDTEFHEIISAAVGNPAWLMAREAAAKLLFPAADPMMSRLDQAPHRLVAAHRRILDGLRAGDVEAAREWMRKHIIDFKRGYELAGLPTDRPVHHPLNQEKDEQS